MAELSCVRTHVQEVIKLGALVSRVRGLPVDAEENPYDAKECSGDAGQEQSAMGKHGGQCDDGVICQARWGRRGKKRQRIDDTETEKGGYQSKPTADGLPVDIRSLDRRIEIPDETDVVEDRALHGINSFTFAASVLLRRIVNLPAIGYGGKW